MKQNKNLRSRQPKTFSPLGTCIDQLSEAIALVDCQFNSLSDVITNYGLGDHHLTLNYIIRNKLKEVYNSLDLQLLKERNKNETE